MSVASWYDEHAQSYDSEYVHTVALAENALMARRLNRFPPGRVLDLACGTGLVLDLLMWEPVSYLGVDISEGMLAVARVNHRGRRFLHASIEEALPEMEDACVDTVTCLFGWQYVRDPGSVAREVFRVLAPGGRVFIVTPRRRVPVHPMGWDAYSDAELRGQFEGFTSVRTRGMTYAPRFAGALGPLAELWVRAITRPRARAQYILLEAFKRREEPRHLRKRWRIPWRMRDRREQEADQEAQEGPVVDERGPDAPEARVPR